jgi:hypothetical protein
MCDPSTNSAGVETVDGHLAQVRLEQLGRVQSIAGQVVATSRVRCFSGSKPGGCGRSHRRSFPGSVTADSCPAASSNWPSGPPMPPSAGAEEAVHVLSEVFRFHPMLTMSLAVVEDLTRHAERTQLRIAADPAPQVRRRAQAADVAEVEDGCQARIHVALCH